MAFFEAQAALVGERGAGHLVGAIGLTGAGAELAHLATTRFTGARGGVVLAVGKLTV